MISLHSSAASGSYGLHRCNSVQDREDGTLRCTRSPGRAAQIATSALSPRLLHPLGTSQQVAMIACKEQTGQKVEVLPGRQALGSALHSRALLAAGHRSCHINFYGDAVTLSPLAPPYQQEQQGT